MDIQVGQVVYVSVFNRLRNAKPYCKQHKVIEVTRTHIITSPLYQEDTPKLWLRFGRNNMSCKSKQSKFEYRIWESIGAFDRSVMEGFYEKA